MISNKIKDTIGLFRESKEWDSITLRGSSNFIKKTIEALDLLKRNVPEAEVLIRDNVSDISEGSSTRAVVKVAGGGWCIISNHDYQGNLISYAATLAHEGYHCWQYKRYKNNFPKYDGPKG
mgnify:FL=1